VVVMVVQQQTVVEVVEVEVAPEDQQQPVVPPWRDLQPRQTLVVQVVREDREMGQPAVQEVWPELPVVEMVETEEQELNGTQVTALVGVPVEAEGQTGMVG